MDWTCGARLCSSMQFPGRILSLSCMSWILLPSSARALVLEPPSRAGKGAPQVRGMPVIVLTGRSAQADLYLSNRSYRGNSRGRWAWTSPILVLVLEARAAPFCWTSLGLHRLAGWAAQLLHRSARSRTYRDCGAAR